MIDSPFFSPGSCSFTQPSAFNGSCKHSGDLTSAPGPKGSSEFVTFKVSDLAHHRVSKVAICIYSYSGQSFDLMPRAFVGIGVIPDSGGDNTVAGDGK